jgi:Peptidase family M1 domain
MRHVLLGVVLLATTPSPAEVPPEVELALQSLRTGERARLEKQLGPVERLPLYRVDLELDPTKRSVSGQVSVVVTPAHELTELHLRSTPNATHPRSVVLSALEVDGKKQALQQPDPSLWRIAFAKPIAAGQAVTLTFKVTAKVPTIDLNEAMSMGGDKPGDYGAFSTSPDVMNLDGIVPMIAPLKPTGELMDGPSGIGDLGAFDPSNFIASVVVPSGWRAVLPGVLSGEVLERSGRPRFTYALAGARELPVLAVHGYESITKQVGDITVEAWHAAPDAASGQKVVEHAAKSIELLEAKLGPTPYKTFRVVEAHFTGGAGGMEFPGLVTVSSMLYHGGANPLSAMGLGGLGNDPALQSLLADLGDLGTMTKQLFAATLEFTVEHEVAHQYFAMLVGNDPVADPLTDEALTQHVALLVMEWRHGKTTADQMRDAQLKMAFQMHRMMGGKDGPANRPTFDFDSNTEYAALVYGKAPLLFDEWRKKLGDEAWLSTLRAYLEANRYKWVTSNTLLELAQKRNKGQAHALAALRAHWWDEVHGDEDLGSLGALGLGGAAMPQQLDPQMIKQYEELMKQLMGGQ